MKNVRRLSLDRVAEAAEYLVMFTVTLVTVVGVLRFIGLVG